MQGVITWTRCERYQARIKLEIDSIQLYGVPGPPLRYGLASGLMMFIRPVLVVRAASPRSSSSPHHSVVVDRNDRAGEWAMNGAMGRAYSHAVMLLLVQFLDSPDQEYCANAPPIDMTGHCVNGKPFATD